MWAVAFVLVVVVVVAVAVALVRRPRGDDVHSVRNYNHALGTLEHLSERIGPPTARPIARQVTPGGPTGSVVPPVPVRGTSEFPDPDAPIVFDDARPHDRPRPGSGDGLPSARTDRAQRMALDSMNHRRRGGAGIAVAVLVVAVFAVLAVLGSHRTRSTTHSSTTTTAAGVSHGSVSTTTRPRPSPTTRPTPTTLPTRLVATTTSAAGTSATYAVPNVSFQITLTGTGPCWVQVDSAATGATEWAGELSAGTVQNIQVSGGATVQFGTPTLTLSVDTIPVVLPTPLRTPFTATFTPSAAAVAAAAAAGPTTTTTTTSSASSTTTTTTSAAG